PSPTTTRTGRHLSVGGQHEELTRHRDIVSRNRDLPATATAEVFEVDTAALTGEWHRVGDMEHPRILCDATLLANGEVLVLSLIPISDG
ncbi:hypothetical protein, partial [Glycomyces tenuis]|uniref:hypothetical protein n=1 Tax=Glycomyces tenuis TaxID=58116 RepID=UPI00055800F3